MIGRASLALLVAMIGLVAVPMSAGATVSGGCSATATASRSGTADLTTSSVWHVKDADVLNGQGTAPRAQKFAQLKVVFFGVGLPLLDRQGNSATGAAGPYRIADYDRYTRVLSVAGTSSTCDGSVLIIVDDVAPLATWAGVLGLIVAALGVVGLIASLFLKPTGSSRVVGMILGFLAGLGVGMVLQQAAILDPANVLGLLIAVAVAVVGLVVAGAFYRPGGAARVT